MLAGSLSVHTDCSTTLDSHSSRKMEEDSAPIRDRNSRKTSSENSMLRPRNADSRQTVG